MDLFAVIKIVFPLVETIAMQGFLFIRLTVILEDMASEEGGPKCRRATLIIASLCLRPHILASS